MMTDTPDRPEPQRRRARPKSREAWAKNAAKAAKASLARSKGGQVRKAMGAFDWPTPSVEHLLAGWAKAPRCTAETKSGARCRCPVVRGSDRCANHEGVERAPDSPAAAKRYLAGTLRPPAGRFKTHPSALLAELGQEASQAPEKAALPVADDFEPED